MLSAFRNRVVLLGQSLIKPELDFLRFFTSRMDDQLLEKTSTKLCQDAAEGNTDEQLAEVLGGGSSVSEGKVVILHDGRSKSFYNPTQEVNRDISILGIQTFINRRQDQTSSKKATILEALAATGMRSIRYAKEISGVDSIIANDFSQTAVESIKKNSEYNKTSEIIVPSLMDASVLMHSQRNTHTVVDIDPYGTPTPFLDSAVQCVQDGGMLLVTATDMALLAGNHPESCFAKYGSMSLKSDACHELALRIVIFTVQSVANRYGRYVEPLLSLKIDFYVRIFFRVTKSPLKCKETASLTSLVYQCTGCRSLTLQPLAIQRSNGLFGFAGPTVSEKCEICNFRFHVGGPIWTGLIQDRDFISGMLETLKSTHAYLNTAPRIEGLLNLVSEELNVPLMYEISQLCSIVKCSCVKLLQLRSALITLGYEVSVSHVGPNTVKTNAPNNVLWDILREWHRLGNGGKPKEGTPGFNILAKEIETKGISFAVREDANPQSRASKFLRFQMNPTSHWGPGVRDFFKVQHSDAIPKKIKNQGRHAERNRKRKGLSTVPTPNDLTSTEGKDSPETKNSKSSV